MAGGGEDKHSKKHPASAKKKKDLKKKGTVPKSQDVPMALGLAAAFGAMLGMKGMLTSRLQAASTQSGGGTLLLEVIAAAVIGGTSLFGGRGNVWGALLGALVIGSVSNGLDLVGQPADVKYMVEGAILLLAVTVDAFSRRRLTSAGR